MEEKLIIESKKDNLFKERKKSLILAIIGFVIVVANLVDRATGGNIQNAFPLFNYVFFAGIIVGFMFFFRYITVNSQANDTMKLYETKFVGYNSQFKDGVEVSYDKITKIKAKPTSISIYDDQQKIYAFSGIDNMNDIKAELDKHYTPVTVDLTK